MKPFLEEFRLSLAEFTDPLLDTMSFGAALVRPNGTLIAVNCWLAEHLAQPRTALVDRQLPAVWGTGLPPDFESQLEAAIASQEQTEWNLLPHQVPFATKGGLRIRLAPFGARPDGGAALLQLAPWHEEGALPSTEASHPLTDSYRNFIDLTSEGFWLVDAEERTVEVNPALCAMLGYEHDDMIGKLPSDFAMPQSRDLLTAQSPFTSKNLHRNYQTHLQHKLGRLLICNFNATTLRDKHGNVTGSFALVTDVTAEQRQDAESKLASAVFNFTSEAIFVTDTQNRIQAVNPAFTAITGYTPDEVLGKDPSILKSQKHDAAFFQNMWQSITEVGQWEGEIWNHRKNGEDFPTWLSIATMRTTEGNVQQHVAVMSDITSRKEAEDTIRHQANYDQLTKLPNRNLLHDRLGQSMNRAGRLKSKVGFLFIDLDHFKRLNDTFGRAHGDQLLIEICRRLSECVRNSDTVGRLEKDTFGIVLNDLAQSLDGEIVAQKIFAALDRELAIEGHHHKITCSIGIAIFPGDGKTPDALIRHAEVAMFQAKEVAGHQARFFTLKMNEEMVTRMRLERDMRYAITVNQFDLYYQPIMDPYTDQIAGAEALMRWPHPERGLVSPGNFIPLAEETGLIVPMGRWALMHACQQAATWTKMGMPIYIAVNLSPRQCLEANFGEEIEQALAASALDPKCLVLEITESLLMTEGNAAIETLKQLTEKGVRLALDDFGTGYSSLSYLKKLPAGVLKIDRAFVRDLPESQEDSTLVQAMISMAHKLGMKVVGEGVETKAQLQFLKDNQCDYIQGFYYCQPLTEEAFRDFLKNR